MDYYRSIQIDNDQTLIIFFDKKDVTRYAPKLLFYSVQGDLRFHRRDEERGGANKWGGVIMNWEDNKEKESVKG